MLRMSTRAASGTRSILTALLLLLAAISAVAQTSPASPPAPEPQLQTADGVVRELYRLVTIAVGDSTDWEQVRNLFIPEAVIVLRVSKDASSTFSLQGWIDDFVAWDAKARVSERGFEERITRLEPMVFRDIAHVLVCYEARVLDSPKPPTVGVDSIELIRKDGRWWIAAITNDLPNAEHPLPPQLQE